MNKFKITKCGKIPSDWQCLLLNSVSKRGSGHTPNKKIPKYYNGGIKWISLADSKKLDDGYIIDTKNKLSKDGLKNSSAVLHPAGTVLISRDAGVGKSAIMYTDMAVSQHFITWTCKENLYNWYLYYYLQKEKQEFERIAFGSTIKTIGLSYFKKYHIPVPPLPEQKKIAQILSTWDRAIEKLDELIEAKKRLKKGLMQQLLTGKMRFPEFKGSGRYKKTKLGMIPEEWEVKRLNELGQFSKGSGILKDDVVEDGLPCIRYGEIYTRHHIIIKEFYSHITESTAANSKLIEKNDILFACSGETLEEIGKSVAYLGDKPAYAGGDIIIFNNKSAHTLYLAYMLSSAITLSQTRKMGQGQSVVHINSKCIGMITFPLMEKDEQIKIAYSISRYDNTIEKLENQRERLKLQKNGLMQKLLTGQVSVKP